MLTAHNSLTFNNLADLPRILVLRLLLHSTGSPTNERVVNIIGGNLYVTSSSTPTYGMSQVGTGLPTTGGQTQTLLTNVVPSGGTATAAISYSFFTDQSTTVAGGNALCVADDGSAIATRGGIQNRSLVNGA